jgi:hypothetical protein
MDLPSIFNPITPDHYLFLEDCPLKTKERNLESTLLEWQQKLNHFPSVLQVDSQVYILGKSLLQCQNKEEYLRSYFEISTDAQSLVESQIYALSSCSKEQFRLHKA